MKIREIYTDGASRGNPGLASYSVVIYDTDGKVTKRGEVFEFRTNNQMELLAGCKALQFIEQARKSGDISPDYRVPIYSDSALLCNMFNKKWIYNWEIKGTIDKHPNNDLIWNLLLQSYSAGSFKFIWVKGHSGNKGNQLADEYCNKLLNEYGK